MTIACVNINVIFTLVQTPSPVKNIKVKPSATSALVTWNIVTRKEDSSYITDYDIYLHPNFSKRIARKDHGTQFNITGLKPCSDYIVVIVAVDGSSQESAMRNISFKTGKVRVGKHKISYNNFLFQLLEIEHIFYGHSVQLSWENPCFL